MIQKRSQFLLAAGLLAALFSQGQSRREWLMYGDAAFKNKEYISAAYFYQHVIDPSSDNNSKDFIYPYDVRFYEPPPKKEKTETDSSFMGSTGSPQVGKPVQTKTDTTAVKKDSTSVKTPPPDVTQGEPKNIIEDIRYQYVTHQIAESFRLGYDYENAEKWYAKAVQNESKQYPHDRYWYALMLMQNTKYQQASQEFETFLASCADAKNPVCNQAEKNIISCKFASDSANYFPENKVKEMDSIFNAGTANFGANFHFEPGSMVFTSARKGSTVTEETKENEIYLADVYLTRKTESGWEKPVNLKRPVNTEMHEGAPAVSFDKSSMYFTRWEKGAEKEEYAIYLSKFLNGMWLQPMKLNENVNVAGTRSMQPYVTPDGSTLYFVSDRTGGKGKLDLWYCSLDEFGNAGPAKNLGTINTSGNETTPFYNIATKNLYFSSDGYIGFGGQDVFKTYANEDSTWVIPKNLGMPINSSRDDNYFVLDLDEKKGFLSSDRKKCENCTPNVNTGYCYKIFEVENEPILLTLKGIVYNKEDSTIMSNALVTIKDIKEEKEDVYLITDENGAYKTLIRGEMEYYLKAQKVRFFGDAATLSTLGQKKSKEYVKDFYLEPIPPGDIVIPGIEYDFNAATLRPESMKVLDTIVYFMNVNDNITFEINSHTDTRGNDKYNMVLSEARAKSCMDYLIIEGIPKERLTSKGYGETKPLVSDKEIAKMKKEEDREAGHQKNRRTAFRTLSEDFKPIKKKQLKQKSEE